MIIGVLYMSGKAYGFCGFYVAKADTKLFNQSSKVAIVRDGDRTVITMANDYQGDAQDFAMVIPVPTIIRREQVHISDPALLQHLDAYTAPRLVEYYDDNPCAQRVYLNDVAQRRRESASDRSEIKNLGVKIEDHFTVGEYDIVILSAQESSGLQIWLKDNGYKMPKAVRNTLRSYIRQGMKFFVARVNLEAQARLGNEFLRPIAVAFESPKFMLPIRLGTVNAKGSQDLFVYALTRNGRVETSNYRTQKIPSQQVLPIFVKDEFGDFYKSMYDKTIMREGGHGVFMEYAWNMNWCDPCAADPLSNAQLRELGVFWLAEEYSAKSPTRGAGIRRGSKVDVFVTRLHIRYDKKSFPEDLKFIHTGNRQNFQGRYILQHAYEGEMDCPAAQNYRQKVNQRKNREIKTLANLTGWSTQSIREKITASGKGTLFDIDTDIQPWWQLIWPKE